MKKVVTYLKQVLKYMLLFVYITPFLIILLNSFKTTEQFVANPFSLPDSISAGNYIDAFAKMNFLGSFTNTLIVTFCSITLIILFASMTAYLFVRAKWRINKFLFALMVAAMIIPFQALMIPLVSIYGSLGILNNIFTLIYMNAGFGLGFAVFTFHGFIKSIPVELEEAAVIDGCTTIQTFFKVVFPLLKSVVVTITVLDILWVWNDYLLPSLILLSPEKRTLPLSTYSFFSTYAVDYGPLMAGLMMTLIPVLIVYVAGQKQIINGVIQGAIK